MIAWISNCFILWSKKRKKQKKETKKTENTSVDEDEILLQENEMDDEDCYFDSDLLKLTGNKVFPDHYVEKFNSLCQRYGKFLSRQSERNLPQTIFSLTIHG